MASYVKILPSHTSSGKSFVEHMRRKVKLVGAELEKELSTEIELILKDLLSNSPIYTGASYGDSNAKYTYKINYPSHPAYQYRHNIGNYFTGGTSGWQIGKRKVNQYATSFFLWNPMYDKYLIYSEKAQAAIRTAWFMHLSRRQ